jgi:hypothetical protein
MNRRSFNLALGLPLPLHCGIGWHRFFELGREEKVQLHDGRVIVVKRKQTYERLGSSFIRYGGTIIRRDSTLSLDAGGNIGVVTQLFKARASAPCFSASTKGSGTQCSTVATTPIRASCPARTGANSKDRLVNGRSSWSMESGCRSR